MSGLFQLTLFGYVIYAAVVTHVTIMAVTIFLHRHQSHRAIELHAIPSHFFRFWLWLTTGMVTKEWVAVHRCHHAKVDTEQDPHSPVTQGIHTILWKGVLPYREAAKNQTIIDKHGAGTPHDWIERHLYSKYPVVGILSMLLLNILLIGWQGIIIWAIQMTWIPFFAAGVVNGIGHYFGYRNYDTDDHSTNFFPLGLIIGGEELHNNHHAYPYAANLARRWFEIDVGFYYIKLLSWFGLAKIKYIAPKINTRLSDFDCLNLQQLHQQKLALLKSFDRCVNQVVLSGHNLPHRFRKLMTKSYHRLNSKDLKKLKHLCVENPKLKQILELKNKLYDILHHSQVKEKMTDLKDWCQACRKSNLNSLIEFSSRIELLIGDSQHV